MSVQKEHFLWFRYSRSRFKPKRPRIHVQVGNISARASLLCTI